MMLRRSYLRRPPKRKCAACGGECYSYSEHVTCAACRRDRDGDLSLGLGSVLREQRLARRQETIGRLEERPLPAEVAGDGIPY